MNNFPLVTGNGRLLHRDSSCPSTGGGGNLSVFLLIVVVVLFCSIMFSLNRQQKDYERERSRGFMRVATNGDILLTGGNIYVTNAIKFVTNAPKLHTNTVREKITDHDLDMQQAFCAGTIVELARIQSGHPMTADYPASKFSASKVEWFWREVVLKGAPPGTNTAQWTYRMWMDKPK